MPFGFRVTNNYPNFHLVEYQGFERHLHIPSTISKIDYLAFNRCTMLESVTIPGAIRIARNAFKNCTALKDVTICSIFVEISNGAFDGCPNLTIHAPAGSFAEAYAKENGIPFEAV